MNKREEEVPLEVELFHCSRIQEVVTADSEAGNSDSETPNAGSLQSAVDSGNKCTHS